jgi:hypothetical protein
MVLASKNNNSKKSDDSLSKALDYMRRNPPFKRLTKATTYLTPMLKIPSKNLKNRINVYFRCQYCTNMFSEMIDGIFIAFIKDKVDNIQRLELSHNPLFESIIEIATFEIYHFRIPEHLVNDYYKILNGQYTKISGEYKTTLLYTYGSTLSSGAKTYVFKSIFPSKEDIKELEDMLGTSGITEVVAKPDLIEETFRVSNFIQIDNTLNLEEENEL